MSIKDSQLLTEPEKLRVSTTNSSSFKGEGSKEDFVSGPVDLQTLHSQIAVEPYRSSSDIFNLSEFI